ncbi:hypothetical protein PG996_002362 [Apiospora saccharicola]|uniref:2EXR domain-containing protein n=1 Tax=Apiospora saccharicola TaxID=335842 RepID=A0ABR1WJ99_9PEZI
MPKLFLLSNIVDSSRLEVLSQSYQLLCLFSRLHSADSGAMSMFTNFVKLPLELRLHIWEYAIKEASYRRNISLFSRLGEHYFRANATASPFLSISTDSRMAALSYYDVVMKVLVIRSPRLYALESHQDTSFRQNAPISSMWPGFQNWGLCCIISCRDQGESFCRDTPAPHDPLLGKHRGYIYANSVKDKFSVEVYEPGCWIPGERIKANRIAEAPNPLCWIGHVISRIKQSRVGQNTHMGEITIQRNPLSKINRYTFDVFLSSGLDFERSPQRIRIFKEQNPYPWLIYRPDISWPIERVLEDLEQFNNIKDWSLLLA